MEGIDDVMKTFAEAGSYTLGGFRPATVYNCSVFGSNSAGDSPFSTVSVKTQDERKLIDGQQYCHRILIYVKHTASLIFHNRFMVSTTNKGSGQLPSVGGE